MLTAWDIVIMSIYFLVLFGIGIYCSLHHRIRNFFYTKILKRPLVEQQSSEHTATEEYFLAGRDVAWWAIGASLFCSNIGAEHFIGLAGTGASEGIAVSYYELSGAYILLLLGYIFVPIYLRSKVFTTPQFIETRFSKHIRTYLALLSLVYYILTKISVTIFAAAIVFETVLGWNMYVSCLVILGATGLYTIFGGLAAVIYTEAMQAVVLLAGTVVLSVLAYTKVGGLGHLMQEMPDKFHFVKPLSDKEFPWIGLFFGIPINGIFYWCADQVMVQRVLCAKNKIHAEVGCTFAGFLKVITVFTMIVPGIMARYLYPEEVGADTNKAFTLLVVRLMPSVLRGLLISAMLSAAMSTLASTFNSASTVFTIDVYKRIRTRATETELVIVGKVFSGVMVVLSVLWIPLIGSISDQLYVYIQSVASYTSPPLAAAFLAGILFKRITGTAAIVAIAVGSVLGAVRFVVEIFFKKSTQGTTSIFLFVFAHMNYLYFAILLFSVSLSILFVFSLVTGRPPRSQIKGFTMNYKQFFKDCIKSCYLLKRKHNYRKQNEYIIDDGEAVTEDFDEAMYEEAEKPAHTLSNERSVVEAAPAGQHPPPEDDSNNILVQDTPSTIDGAKAEDIELLDNPTETASPNQDMSSMEGPSPYAKETDDDFSNTKLALTGLPHKNPALAFLQRINLQPLSNALAITLLGTITFMVIYFW